MATDGAAPVGVLPASPPVSVGGTGVEDDGSAFPVSGVLVAVGEPVAVVVGVPVGVVGTEVLDEVGADVVVVVTVVVAVDVGGLVGAVVLVGDVVLRPCDDLVPLLPEVVPEPLEADEAVVPAPAGAVPDPVDWDGAWLPVRLVTPRV